MLAAAAEAAGVPPRVADRGPSAPPKPAAAGPEPLDLVPTVHAAEGLSLDLAGGFDWAAFAPVAGRVPVEALGQLALARPAVDDWLAGNLVTLLAVAEGDRRGMTALLAREAEWGEAVLAARGIALLSLEKPMGPAEEARWTAAVKALRERTDALQSRIDAAARAAGALGPDPDAGLRKAIADKQGIEPAPASPVARPEGRPWLLLGAAASVLALGLLGLVLVLRKVLGRRPAEGPAADAVVPSAVPRLLTDARGQAHALDRECLTLGTAADNDVVLASPHASRHHARVFRTAEGTCWIEDLGSTNGTWVDGQRTEKAWLQPGSLVALGDETLRVS